MSQLVKRLETPVLIVSPEAYWQGHMNEAFTEMFGDDYFNGYRIVISTHLERDEHVTTLREMPCPNSIQ
jgi:(2Fe-2S) ferredoxin